MKECAFCGEAIQDEERVCHWCHAVLSAASPAAPPAAGGAAPPAPAIPETSGLAIGSLVCGILFFLLPSAIAAIIMGHISRAEIRRSGGQKKGEGMALAGLILGYTGVSIVPIVIIAAIAIPSLMRSRIAANEASAVSSLRTLNNAIVLYHAAYGTFPSNLAAMGPPPSGEKASARSADLVTVELAAGAKAGYAFHYEAFSTRGDSTLDLYRIYAEPMVPNQTGLRYYFSDQTGVTRFATGERADENSPPLP